MKKRIPGRVSLDRALSKLGLASRTQARALIEAGKVTVNGFLRTDPGFQLKPETARIEIDGITQSRTRFMALLLHKPKGVITSRSDEKGRPTVFSLLDSASFPEAGHLIAVGRLDFATTGLLLLTNDSRFSAWLTDPGNAVPRTYVVTVRGEITDEKLKRLKSGIRDEGETLKPETVEVRKSSGKESHLTVTLTEGKNREIRRLFLALGNEVTRLKRIRYGSLELGDLAPGSYRELSLDEIRTTFPKAPIKLDD